MRIHSIRLGHATNSSSSHSIIIMDRPVSDSHDGGEEYGWGDFTLASKEAKIPYLGQILLNSLNVSMSPPMASAIVKDLLGHTPDTADGYIDHQSLWSLPRNRDGHVDMVFVREMFDHLLRDGIVILGGNDNSDRHPLRGTGRDVGIPFGDLDRGPMVSRKDPLGFWTLFNSKTGAKIRLSFGDMRSDIASPERSSTPELVDMKITNHCDRGCSFCYQDSNRDGKHAVIDNVVSVLHDLAELGTFEIAIGGGEPLDHPDLDSIIERAAKYGIVPNITTRSPEELLDKHAGILPKLGAIGVSVSYPSDLDKIVALRHAAKFDKQRLVAHMIEGVNDLERLVPACAALDIPVLILGLKRTGRAAKYGGGYYKNGGIVDAVAKARIVGYPTISIDTAIAAKHKAVLDAMEVDARLYETHEGKFSMYVDAVTMRAAPSSYCDDKLFQSIASAEKHRFGKYQYGSIGKVFASFAWAKP